MITTTIQGIPCEVEFSYYRPGRPAITNAEPDFCHEGEPAEFELTVYDRKGRPADWLAAKLTEEDEARICKELLKACAGYY